MNRIQVDPSEIPFTLKRPRYSPVPITKASRRMEWATPEPKNKSRMTQYTILTQKTGLSSTRPST